MQPSSAAGLGQARSKPLCPSGDRAAIQPVLLAGAIPPAGDYDADVIILALDRAEDTEWAIHSALAQEGVSRHVIVLDQGSQPETLARLTRAIAGRADAMLVSLNANLGVAGGRNCATSLGRGRAIIGLDNDAAFARTDTLAHAVAVLEEDRTLAAIGFRILAAATREDDLSCWGYPPALLSRAAQCFNAVTFVGAGHAIRRTAWREAGGYDAALFFCWEELDFCRRAIAHGWRVAYRGDMAVLHRVSPERRVRWDQDRWYYFVRNRLLIERRWGASWVGLAPRACGYLLKGLHNRTVRASIRGILAAQRMGRARPPLAMPPSGRAYLLREDHAHRGGLLRRFRTEVWRLLPRPG